MRVPIMSMSPEELAKLQSEERELDQKLAVEETSLPFAILPIARQVTISDFGSQKDKNRVMLDNLDTWVRTHTTDCPQNPLAFSIEEATAMIHIISELTKQKYADPEDIKQQAITGFTPYLTALQQRQLAHLKSLHATAFDSASPTQVTEIMGIVGEYLGNDYFLLNKDIGEILADELIVQDETGYTQEVAISFPSSSAMYQYTQQNYHDFGLELQKQQRQKELLDELYQVQDESEPQNQGVSLIANQAPSSPPPLSGNRYLFHASEVSSQPLPPIDELEEYQDEEQLQDDQDKDNGDTYSA